MAHIKKRKTSQGITFHLVDKINGKDVTKKLPVRNMGEAREYLYKYLGDKADNRPNSLLMQKTNFKDFVENKFLVISKAQKMENTYRKDLLHMKTLMMQWQHNSLDSITAEDIQFFQTKCQREGLSNKTINNRVAILSSILRMAYKQKLIVRMPEIKLLKLDKLPPKCFSDDQVKTILDQAQGFVRDVVIVALNTGMRSGEMRRLKWDDVDFKNNQITVRISKNKRYRVIPLNELLANHLREMKLRNREFVFEVNGQPCCESALYRPLKRFLRGLNIQGDVHALRHTVATLLARKGESLYIISRILGHSTIKTTERYAHLRSVDLESAVDVLQTHGTVTEPKQKLHLVA